MQKDDFFVDRIWHANRDQVPDMLVRLFESDIQGSISYCAELLDALLRSSLSDNFDWQTGGNAYIVTVRNNKSQIACQYTDEPAFEISNTDFEKLLKIWIEVFEEYRKNKES